MRKNASYLDSLNDGRKRRSRTSLDDLDRTLRGLEERIGAGSGGGEGHHDRGGSRDVADRFRHLASDRHTDAQAFRDRPLGERLPPSSSFRTLAQDVEFARIQEKNVAAVESIAAELKNLRGELQNKMTAGLHREFDALRGDIAETYRAAQAGSTTKEISEDIARLSDNIRALAQRSDDSGVNMLRLELEEMKQALGAVAREESVQQFNERWDQLDRRWESMHSVETSPAGLEPEFEALAARLEEISSAVNSLPSSLPLGSLEGKLHDLSAAVESLATKSDPVSTQFIDTIEQRLDEISRAIVASSVSVQAAAPNTEQFERIEARISSLANQIEELSDTQPTSNLLDRINSLAERVEDLTFGPGQQPDVVDNLSAQIAALSEKMDAGGSGAASDAMLRELEQRYETIVDRLERQHEANEQQAGALLRDLESRLDAIGTTSQTAVDSGDQDSIIRAIDVRFNELAQHLDNTVARDPNDGTMRGLEERLDEISRRLDSTGSVSGNIDTDLIRSLENQIAGLTQHLQKPDSIVPDYEDIGPRIKEIESSLAGNREQIMEAAREAAEWAIRSLPASSGDGQSVLALAEDLKSLEHLTRNSDERNTRTFEAIHDTLLKIVDRLGSLEAGSSASASNDVRDNTGADASASFAGRETPSIQPAERDIATSWSEPEMGSDRQSRGRGLYGDAEAVMQAAGEAPSKPSDLSTDAEKKSMLGGLARALKGKSALQASETPVLTPADEPVTGKPSDHPSVELGPEDAHKPLEPGSGAPDVGSIMARVTNERNAPPNGEEADTAKSDFIAAARRAAQAAAAEAESNRSNGDNGTAGGRFKGLDILQRKRKPILVGASALLIALAGLQLGKAFLGSDGSSVVAEAPISGDGDQAGGESQEAASVGPAGDAPGDDRDPVRVVGADESAAVDAANNPAGEGVPPEAEMAAEVITAAPVEEQTVTVEPAPSAEIAAVPVEAGPVALREAAQSGDAKALYEVGSRYAEGRGVRSNLKEAAKWYQVAADLGFAPAQYRIGNFFEKGLGLERDPAKAMTWYQMAAEQGNASAMHNLAVLYAMGANGQPDNESAARWFGQAAELGIKDSQFNLGILSAKGVGVPQNLEESYKWFALAAKSGDTDAASKRDEIANALRPEQLSTARAAVELWKAKPVVKEVNTVEIPAAWKEDNGKTAGVDLKKAVKNIQLILNKNGYDAGPADGVMGARTKTAIAAFQKDNGMPATGEVDEALVKALLAKNE